MCFIEKGIQKIYVKVYFTRKTESAINIVPLPQLEHYLSQKSQ